MPTDVGTRSAFVIRVNIHNRDWNGTICPNATRHDDCHASAEFKANYCAMGEPRCFFLALFQPGSPDLRLPKKPNNQPTYERVFAAQRPERGDLAIFWGTYADGHNYPVGLWEVDSFDELDTYNFHLTGLADTVVRFAPKACDWPVLNSSVSRALGGDMIRLLPAERWHTVLRRWADDHEAEIERLRALGRDTDKRAQHSTAFNISSVCFHPSTTTI